MVATTTAYAYYTKRLAQYTDRHVKMLERQEPILKTQVALLAFQVSATWGPGVVRPSYGEAEVKQKLRELGLEE